MKVLVIDDNSFARDFLSVTLKEAGYEVCLAESGPQGIDVAAREQPEVVLLDLMMPGVSGLDVCRAIRRLPILRDAVIFLVTALRDREHRMLGFQVGADEFLSKPIDRRELIARLRTIERLARFRRLCQYDELARLSPDVMMTIDTGGRITFSNQAGRDVFGETVGQPFAQLIAGQQGSPDEWHALLNQAGPRAQFELEFVRADGATFPGELTLSQGPQRALVVTTAIIRDRSEPLFLRHRIEQAQRAETTARAAQGIAHDLSNYLFSLKVANDVARAQVPDDSMAIDYLNDTRDIITQADELVRMLSRLGTPNLGERGRLSLNQCVRSARALLTHLADGAHIRFELAAPENLSAVLDPTGIVQVLANLVCNARDAAGAHGRIVVRTYQRGTGSTSSVVDNSPVLGFIEVTNDGRGMPAATASRLFDPHFTTKTSQSELRGLGLKTSRSIVEINGGRIAASSSEQEGTTFTVSFPAV